MRVLITADIHIGNYSEANYTTNARLDQFDKLADRLLELKEENNCDEIWILGDFLRVPNSKQRVNNKLKSFIVKICRNTKVVRFILGNHDTESKSSTQELEDSVLGLTDLIDNFIYEDHKVETWDNHTFAFMNWRPEQDLTWLDEGGFGKVDILLGHYTKSDLFGQEIDESKFDLMIHGDIHNDQVIGKFVSVCNPIQHDMNSQANGKCIILDTATLQWKHIEVDENHTRFLRISYTPDKDKEGFIGPLQYNIYKPARLGNQLVDDDLSAITWDDIDKLINELVLNKNVLDIHSEVVTKCIPFNEIDFNFQLKHVEIKGYRSVTDFSMDFEPGDRILLLGKNGSGKSSIIRALKGVFEKGVYLTYEKSDLCDECYVKVQLFYQNKLYEITKGDRWSFFINGEQQNYNNKTEFENDIPNKLPFVNYLDLLFIMSNVQNLSGQFSPQRRIELISRFYRLDKITAYCNTAIQLRNELWEELNKLKGDRNTEQGILDHINQQIDTYQDVANEDQLELIEEKSRLLSIRTKAQAYNEYMIKLNSLESQITAATVEKQNAGMVEQIDLEAKKSEKANLEAKVDALNNEYQLNIDKASKFVTLTTDIAKVQERGTQLNREIQQLKLGFCPECGTLLKDSKSKDLITKREDELVRCREAWSKLNEQLNTDHPGVEDKFYYINKNKEITVKITEVKSSIDILANKILTYERAKAVLSSIDTRLMNLNNEMASLVAIKPEQVQLLENQSELESEVTRKLTRLEQYSQELVNKNNQLIKLKDLDEAIKVKVDREEKLFKYIDLTSITGEIFESILQKLAEQFSTPKVKYEVQSWVSRGKRNLAFNSYYFSRKYRVYESLSDGQKTVCDLDFLDKLFSIKVGVLVLDEHLKHLDEDNYPEASELLSQMKCNTLLVSTHDPNYTNFTKRVMLQLDDVGRTEYQIL